MREAAICGLFCFNYLSVYFYGMTSNKEGQPVLSSLLRSNYYYSLNGFRGISIILVVFYHLQLSDNYIYTTIFNGGLGGKHFLCNKWFFNYEPMFKRKGSNRWLIAKKILYQAFFANISFSLFIYWSGVFIKPFL